MTSFQSGTVYPANTCRAIHLKHTDHDPETNRNAGIPVNRNAGIPAGCNAGIQPAKPEFMRIRVLYHIDRYYRDMIIFNIGSKACPFILLMRT